MKVIVFGGSGFLGSHVADSLSEAGHEVTIFDINESEFLRSDQKLIIGDILDRDSIFSAVKGQDVVMNFAGIADLDDATTKPIKTINLNILGTAHIMDACLEFDVKRFIYASTIYVHSEKGGFYRCSKQATEIYIEEYNRKFGLDFTILRYGTLYGPRSDNRNSIYRYIDNALNNKEIVCGGTGDEIREYIHVKDAAELSVKAMNEEYANKHIIITGHHAMRVKDMLNMILEILNDGVEIKYLNKSSDAHYNITPYSYKPKYSFKLVNDYYHDMGSGLVDTIHEVSDAKNTIK